MIKPPQESSKSPSRPLTMPLRTSLYRKPSSGRWANRLSKRKEVLSVNMISLPLADFRHLSHIGNSAHTDSFGDLSFLKMGHGLLLQSSQSEQNIFMACSPPPKPPRLNLDEADGSECPEWGLSRQLNAPQKKKKCSSMPLLDTEDGEMDGEKWCQRESNNKTSADRSDKGAGQEEDISFSFSLDLGPSILEDVLQVMEKLHK